MILIFLTPLWGEQGSYFSHFYSREYWGTNKLYSFLKVIQLCRAGTCDHSLICSLIHTASFSHIKYLWDGSSLAKPYASWWRCSEHIVHFFKELMLQSGKLTKKETVFGVGGWERLRATRHSDKCCHMPKHWVFCEHKKGAPDLALGTEAASWREWCLGGVGEDKGTGKGVWAEKTVFKGPGERMPGAFRRSYPWLVWRGQWGEGMRWGWEGRWARSWRALAWGFEKWGKCRVNKTGDWWDVGRKEREMVWTTPR